MKAIIAVGCTILFVVIASSFACAQEGGMFSSYLVGVYDQRSAYTVFQIVNPTANDIEIYMAFFDDNENPQTCIKEKLSHNDLFELNVKALKLRPKFGVVKIVSLLDKKPVPGIVGFQRTYFTNAGGKMPFGVAESNLASVPDRILDDELKIIMDRCK